MTNYRKYFRTNREGAEMLAQAGIDFYERNTNVQFMSDYLPYNLAKHGPAVCEMKDNKAGFYDPEGKTLELYARFGGWMKKAASSEKCKTLRNLIRKATSHNGVNSPRTTLDLWAVVEGFSSPEKANKKLLKMRFRANQILAPYGVKVSNDALAETLNGGFRHTKRAAKLAAKKTLFYLLAKYGFNHKELIESDVFQIARGLAGTMREEKVIKYWMAKRIERGLAKNLREALEDSARLVIDRTDGVECVLDPHTSETRHGITVTFGYHAEEQWIEEIALVTRGERTFHTRPHSYSEEEFDSADVVGKAIKDAIKGWRLQDRIRAEAEKELNIPSDCTMLVWKEDSLKAGNCKDGTEAFMSSIGLKSSVQFVPVDRLLPHMDYWRVRNTVDVAVKKFYAAQGC